MQWQLAAAFVLVSVGSAVAQPTITVLPSPVPAGQPLTIGGMACGSDNPVVSFGGVTIAATPGKEPGTFQVSTDSLTPNTYKVTMRCGAETSAEASVQIVAAQGVAQNPQSPQPGTARVLCVENLTPKDGFEYIGRGTRPADAPNCDPNLIWTVRIDDAVTIHVAGFKAWRDHPTNKDKSLRLFIDGIELDTLEPRDSSTEGATPDALWAAFKFEDTDTAKRQAWEQVLRIARRKDRLALSVGPTGGPQWPTTAQVHFNLYPRGFTRFAVILLAVLLVALVVLGVKSNLLRDDNGSPNPPYSLAKHQMALWFVVVVGAYLFVTMTTGVAAATSPTALILIGISGATGLAAVVIDKNKREAAVNERRALEAERVSLQSLLDDPTSGLRVQLARAAAGSTETVQLGATIQTKLERLNAIAGLLAAAPSAPRSSDGWIFDLLSDENGISFHRLQIAVWTVVLIGTFITAVWRSFAMPEFDATTLGLMGISSGTYLGFKFPERQT